MPIDFASSEFEDNGGEEFTKTESFSASKFLDASEPFSASAFLDEPDTFSASEFLNEPDTGERRLREARHAPQEAVAAIATGIVATPIAGLAGIGAAAGNALGLTDTEPADVVEKVQTGLTYSPRTETGRELTEAIAWPFEKLSQGANVVGEHVADVSGPLAGTAVKTAIEFIPWVVGPKIAQKGFAKAKAAIPGSAVETAANAVRRAVSPLTIGSPEAMVAAKDFANAVRGADAVRNLHVHRLTKEFSPVELKGMADALIVEESGAPGLIALTPKQAGAVKYLQEQHAPIEAQAIEIGILKGRRDSYYPRKLREALGDEAMDRVEKAAGIRTTTKHAKARKHETVEETELAATELMGKEMEVIRDIRVLPLVTAELERAIAGRTLVNEIKSFSEGLGLEAIRAEPAQGYFQSEVPALRGMYIHESFRGPLEGVTKRGSSSQIANAFVTLKGKTMSAIMFSPLMHNMVIWGKALPYQPLRSLTLMNYFQGAKLSKNPEFIRLAASEGLAPIGQMGWMQRMSDVLQAPKLEPGRSWTAKIAGAVARVAGKKASVATMRSVDWAGSFWHDKLLWEQISNAQYGMYANLRNKFIQGGMPENAAGQVASHLANRFAGSIPYEDMGQGVRTAGNLMLFSRTFNATNIGIYKDALKGLPRAVQESIIKKNADIDMSVANDALKAAGRATLVKDIVAMYVMNSMLQSTMDYMRTGDAGEVAKDYADRWDRYTKEGQEHPAQFLLGLSSLSATHDNEPGKENRVLTGYLPDGTATYYRNPLGKIGEDLLKAATSPIELLTDKLSPDAKFISGLMFNDKTLNRKYGLEVYSHAEGWDRVLQNIGDISFWYLESHFPVDYVDAGIKAITGKDPEGVYKQKAIGAPLGASFSKGAPGGPEKGFAYKVLTQHKIDMRRIAPRVRALIKEGREDEAIDVMIDEGKATAREVKSILKKTINPSISSEVLKRFYEIADEKEMDRIERMLLKKQPPTKSGE